MHTLISYKTKVACVNFYKGTDSAQEYHANCNVPLAHLQSFCKL